MDRIGAAVPQTPSAFPGPPVTRISGFGFQVSGPPTRAAVPRTPSSYPDPPVTRIAGFRFKVSGLVFKVVEVLSLGIKV